MTTKDTPMTTLDLAERCQQASGPDYFLDSAIHRFVVAPEHKRWTFDHMGDLDKCWLWGDPKIDEDWDKPAPAYTGSVDAAMQLVPDAERDFHLLRSSISMDMGRKDWRCNIGGFRGKGAAITPALAICAAALRARTHP